MLLEHGPGVYTVQVWARLAGEMEVISGYSLFHEVEVPELSKGSPVSPYGGK